MGLNGMIKQFLGVAFSPKKKKFFCEKKKSQKKI